MILSFHPCIEGDVNILCAGRPPGDEDVEAAKKARAIILPQGVTEQLYRLCRIHCPHVFPNYDARFDYPGKLGQSRLFQENKVSFPPTVAFSDINAYQETFEKGKANTLPFDFPFVLKLNEGGEGEGVFLLENQNDLDTALGNVAQAERSGQKGFIVQAHIPNEGRTLRVVVIGEQFFSYWRIQEDKDVFQSNLRTGARIDHHLAPESQEAAIGAARNFCRSTGINLAGFDFLFPQDASEPQPLFLEINYFFGRRGLGGSFKFYALLEKAVEEWLAHK
ncbi:MAG: glutathione synthase [Deltaproteobacteria bacterium]|nr:glutathione synthase [Deltaproteobacteria bacterium]